MVARAAVLVIVAWALGSARAADDGAAARGDVRTGAYQLKLTERSPQSPIARQSERCGWPLAAINQGKQEKDYTIGEESFEVWVPDSYTDDGTWGLMVWISAGGDG